MSHFAVVAPPLHSHVKALQALAQALLARGHQVTFIQQADAASLLDDPRIGFAAVGRASHPPGSLARTLRHAAHPQGLGITRVIADLCRSTEMLCRELPATLNALAVDGVIADQMEAAGGLVAEGLGLPFVSVACALPVNREPGLPLPVMPFAYATDARAQQLYQHSERVYDWLMRRHGAVIARHAQAFGLPPRHALHHCLSPLAQLSQTLPGLDFPRRQLPACFHSVGPLRGDPPGLAAAATLPPGPFVFASLGTLQGQRFGLWQRLVQACRKVGVAVLVAHCGGLDSAQAEALRRAGAACVTDFVDQRLALQQAQAVISHGGLNTVMDAIAAGTPLLAVPLAFDQPGVAARVAWAGIGRRSARWHRAPQLATQLRALLEAPEHPAALQRLRAQWQHAPGSHGAAALAEQALLSKRPVLAEHAA